MSINNISNNFGNLSNKPSSAARLLSVPRESPVGEMMGDIPIITRTGTASASIGTASTGTASTGTSFWRYLIVFLILCVLGLNLILFLIKPADKDITHLYDPITNFFTSAGKGPTVAAVSKKNNNTAIKKLEKVFETKPVINNIDNKQTTNLQPEPIKKYKKLPVIPEADDTTSRVQMNPTSKSGFCYIGEDRGFRSCIEVGAGDVCMSGDIFPTEAICINPNLRE
jgi:hypothetical protein